jgi:hypothetical protein
MSPEMPCGASPIRCRYVRFRAQRFWIPSGLRARQKVGPGFTARGYDSAWRVSLPSTIGDADSKRPIDENAVCKTRKLDLTDTLHGQIYRTPHNPLRVSLIFVRQRLLRYALQALLDLRRDRKKSVGITRGLDQVLRKSGWEAGTRTPIDRSRVPPPTFRLNNINHLAWHNAENFGKIRKTAARRKKGGMSSHGTSRKTRFGERRWPAVIKRWAARESRQNRCAFKSAIMSVRWVAENGAVCEPWRFWDRLSVLSMQ